MRLQRAMTHLPAPSEETSTALAPPQGFIQRQYCALSVEAQQPRSVQVDPAEGRTSRPAT